MPCDKKNNQACHKDYCIFSPGTVMPCRLKSPISFHKFTSCSHKKNPVLISRCWHLSATPTVLTGPAALHFYVCDCFYTKHQLVTGGKKIVTTDTWGKMRMYKNLPLERSCWHPPWQHVERYSLVQTAGHFLWTKQHTHTKNAGFKVKCRQTQKYTHLSEQNKQVCGIEEYRKDFSKSAKPKTPQLPTWSSHMNAQLLPLLC